MKANNMSNGVSSTQRRSREMDKLLRETMEKIKQAGYEGKMYMTNIERLFVNYLRNNGVDELLAENFREVTKIKPEIQRIMYGQAIL